MNERPEGHVSFDSEETLDRELNIRAILYFGLGLVATIVVFGVLMWVLTVQFRDARIAQDPPPPALPEARQSYPPTGPLLQAFPEHDLRELLARDREAVERYAWVDQEAGIARVPIERAMELLIEQYQAPGPDAAEAPTP